MFRPLVSRRRVCSAGCCCGGFGRRCALGWLCHLSLGGRLTFVSRWRVCPAGCCCGCFAAGALWSWLCRLDLGWVLGRVDRLRIRRTSPLFFPLQTIAPSLRGLPAPAGWGSHNPRAFSYIRQYWQSSGEILEYWNVRTDPSGEMRRAFSCMHQYWQSSGEILEYWNVRTDLSGEMRHTLFLYAPVLVIIWGDFGILECPHGPFRKTCLCTVCKNGGTILCSMPIT